jgi:hypothetical protein
MPWLRLVAPSADAASARAAKACIGCSRKEFESNADKSIPLSPRIPARFACGLSSCYQSSVQPKEQIQKHTPNPAAWERIVTLAVPLMTSTDYRIQTVDHKDYLEKMVGLRPFQIYQHSPCSILNFHQAPHCSMQEDARDSLAAAAPPAAAAAAAAAATAAEAAGYQFK